MAKLNWSWIIRKNRNIQGEEGGGGMGQWTVSTIQKSWCENLIRENWGKYYCMADLLFEWFGFEQASKTVAYWK